MGKIFDRKIVLENGMEFLGYGFGAYVEMVSEIVFTTGMCGYQEILTDPSCTGQMVVMTYPLIGNYGITDEDNESYVPTMGGFIVREYNDEPSNFRFTKTLSEVMEEHGIPGISGLDTRYLAKIIRDEGCMKVIITSANTPTETALEKLRATELPRNQVAQVSCKKRWYSRTAHPKYNVVAVDCGIKHNMIRALNAQGCNVIVVPYNITPDEVMRLAPDGVLFSNGPGNPEDILMVSELAGALRGKVPMFGICMGQLMMALAYGAQTYKLKYGHRGGNHPVKNLLTGKIEMTSQDHSYSVVPDSLEGTGLEVTHINVLDNTIEGMRNREDKMMCVQYHPEGAPGPNDSAYLFNEFISLMDKAKEENENA